MYGFVLLIAVVGLVLLLVGALTVGHAWMVLPGIVLLIVGIAGAVYGYYRSRAPRGSL